MQVSSNRFVEQASEALQQPHAVQTRDILGWDSAKELNIFKFICIVLEMAGRQKTRKIFFTFLTLCC